MTALPLFDADDPPRGDTIWQPFPPSRGNTPAAKHCSHEGAEKAATFNETLQAKLLALYRKRPHSDVEAANALGVIRTSVIPRRFELVQLGHAIVPCGTAKNPATGVSNTRWGFR